MQNILHIDLEIINFMSGASVTAGIWMLYFGILCAAASDRQREC